MGLRALGGIVLLIAATPACPSRSAPTSSGSSRDAGPTSALPSGSTRLQAANPTAGDLVFVGTVTEIAASPAPDAPTLGWVVTTKVERVEIGVFTEPTFSFRIHSATRSGLQVGGSYTIRATRTATGYSVDPLQWHP